jgi:hypothetical protein
MIGYLKGYVTPNRRESTAAKEPAIDHVFVDIPCLAERSKDVDLPEVSEAAREDKLAGMESILNRCFGDPMSAMKHADDTGFIAMPLKHCDTHSSKVHSSEAEQDDTVGEIPSSVAHREEETLRGKIKVAADPLKMGDSWFNLR